MATKLAEETLRDILTLALDVPDDDFASTADVSPFALRQFSTADLLLVCKHWMRVATPLLYETVVLRSLAQSQALAKALKKNPEFAAYLKKLRIEGAFGASAGKNLSAATGLTDLCLSVDLSHKDNIRPLCQALDTVAPRRLFVVGRPRENGPVRALTAGLMTASTFWSSLVSLGLNRWLYLRVHIRDRTHSYCPLDS